MKFVLEYPNRAYENPFYVLYNLDEYKDDETKYIIFMKKTFTEEDILWIEKDLGITREESKKKIIDYSIKAHEIMFKNQNKYTLGSNDLCI